METKFKLGQVVKLNDGKFSGTIHQLWLSVDEKPQYSVVWWDGGFRHQQWVREAELMAA